MRVISRHPRFDQASYAASRATADVALLKLSSPLPDIVVPATLAAPRRVAAGDTLTIAGYGVTVAGTARGLGLPRMATLTMTGTPGSLQIRLYDIATKNQHIGLGGCTGDSGAPVFDGDGPLVIGVISWSTAPGDEEGCGDLTGVTPLVLYRDWMSKPHENLILRLHRSRRVCFSSPHPPLAETAQRTPWTIGQVGRLNSIVPTPAWERALLQTVKRKPVLSPAPCRVF